MGAKHKPCPVCPRGGLGRHCPETNTMCTWYRCGACHVVVDLAGRRGYDRSGMPVTWQASA